jgi:hypothetical protein
MELGFSVCEILPHLGFQCSVKTLNDTGFGLLVVSGKEVHVVFLEKLYGVQEAIWKKGTQKIVQIFSWR